MSWGAPVWLWTLLAPAAGLVALVAMLFIRWRAGAVRWPQIQRVEAVGARVQPARTRGTSRRPWLLLLAVAGAILALARPRWGEIEEPVVEHAREVLIAMDLSRSMLAEDIPPSRLERARLLVQGLLGRLQGERVGLVVFAGTSFVQVPLSADYQIIREFLTELAPSYMPQGGTDYTGMLRAALGGFSTSADVDRFLIILSDGESLTDDWRGEMAALQERGVRVIALGVGTARGGFIPDPKTGYVKDERGAVVLSRLEPATLQELARNTGGAFRDASLWVDLAALIDETVARGRAAAFTERRNARLIERFQWFLGPAVLLAGLGLWREVGVRARPRHVRPTAEPPASAAQPARQVPGGIAAALAVACALAVAGNSRALDARAPGASAEPPAADATADKLRETVSRLADLPARSAADWKEMAERTVEFGIAARTSGGELPPGVIHDALAAVDRGEAADPSAADWPTLRGQLTALLEPPPPPEQQPPPDQQQNQDQQQQPQDQPQSGGGSPPPEQQQNPPDQPKEPQPPPPGQQPRPPPESKGLGDLKNEPQPPPQAQSGQPQEPKPKTRRIPSRTSPADQPPPESPEQAAALQRLREATEKDSPARLFDLLQGEPTPQNPGRDW